MTHLLSSSVSEVVDIDTKLLEPIAAKFNLSLISFGKVVTDPSVPYYGSVVFLINGTVHWNLLRFPHTKGLLHLTSCLGQSKVCTMCTGD